MDGRDRLTGNKFNSIAAKFTARISDCGLCVFNIKVAGEKKALIEPNIFLKNCSELYE